MKQPRYTAPIKYLNILHIVYIYMYMYHLQAFVLLCDHQWSHIMWMEMIHTS